MKNLTKNTLLAAVATVTVIAAPIANAQEVDFSGTYIGAGIALNKANTNATVTPDSAVTLDSKSKVGGGLYGGFGTQMDQLYLGLEGGFYLNGSPEPTAAFGTTSTGLKSKNTFDIGARAGFVVNQALLYGTVGYSATQFETIGLTTNDSKRLSGLRYGGGIEFAVNEQISLRGEYTHANYQDWDVVNGADTIRFNPSEHRFMVGASFRF